MYDCALRAGLDKTQGLRVPAIPLSKAAYAMSEEELAKLKERLPIMPKQNRAFGKKLKTKQAPKSAIKIAKPEMTQTGFEHTKTNLKEK